MSAQKRRPTPAPRNSQSAGKPSSARKYVDETGYKTSDTSGGTKDTTGSDTKKTSDSFDPRVWLKVCEPEKGDAPLTKPPKNRVPPISGERKGWKTIRIFVSSTFRDFHQEREVLVKKVFPDLRAWCQKRRLYLVECDLRWGVPKDSPDEKTLRACLEEIDRGIEDNQMPYFINLTSERVGWIPAKGQVPSSLEDKYRWIFGMSVTEMEIIHGAYRKENPNALFLIRDPAFIDKLPENFRKDFKDETETLAPLKLPTLKDKIEERFPPGRVVRYQCKYDEKAKKGDKAVLQIPENFETEILRFFKTNIGQQYPKSTRTISDPLERQAENHEAFMKGRVDFLSEKDDVVRQVLACLNGKDKDKPVVLVGNPWAGVITVLNRVAENLHGTMAEPQNSGVNGTVHSHFVGKKLKNENTRKKSKSQDSCWSGELEDIKQCFRTSLLRGAERQQIFTVDLMLGENDREYDELKDWFPEKLPPSVRAVFSVEEGSKEHKVIIDLENKPKLITVPKPTRLESQILQDLKLNEKTFNKPVVLVGSPGSGKTTITAKVVDILNELAKYNRLDGGGDTGWRLFYHFVGAVPGSTDSTSMLKRLLTLLDMEESISGDITRLKQSCFSALSNANTRPLILIIDAVNQMDEELGGELLSWLPSELSPSVRVLISMIDGCGHHDSIMARESPPHVITVSALTLTERKDIVQRYLKKHQKELSTDQMVTLLEKSDNPSFNNPIKSTHNKDIVDQLGLKETKVEISQITRQMEKNASLQPGSNNPLWLNVACEELRVYGLFRKMDEKIKELPDNLLGLLGYVFERFESELDEDCDLMKATLCLLETSKAGLCEVEIKEILGDQTHLLPGDNPEAESAAPLFKRFDPPKRVADLRWHSVYRVLRPFLRPYGESGEGRLDFYHRTLSKVVRKRYLNTKGDANVEPYKEVHLWWHRKLADFFESSSIQDRRVEEYPHHLIAIDDKRRLNLFLLEWPSFDKLYDQDLSMTLLAYWRKVDPTYAKMAEGYSNVFPDDKKIDEDEKCIRTIKVATVLMQAHKFDIALELGEAAMKICKNVGSSSDTKVEIYKLFAEIYNLKGKTFKTVCREQTPSLKLCIEYNDQAIKILRKRSGKDAKRMLGCQLLNRATARSSLIDVVGLKEGGVDSGMNDVEEAYTIFKELKDESRIAEAMLEKAALMNLDLPNAFKIYKSALKRCEETNGKFHILTSRIYKNTGICAEDMAKGIGILSRLKGKGEAVREHRKNAYTYYKGYYEITQNIFGPNHPKSEAAIRCITRFADVAEAEGEKHLFSFLSKK